MSIKYSYSAPGVIITIPDQNCSHALKTSVWLSLIHRVPVQVGDRGAFLYICQGLPSPVRRGDSLTMRKLGPVLFFFF